MCRAPDSQPHSDTDGVHAVADVNVIEEAEDGAHSTGFESGLDNATDVSADGCRTPMSAPRRAILFGLTVATALSVLLGWLGFRAYQAQHRQAERSQFLQVAQQGALNLTTIDWQHADTDVQQILDSATGQFYDDFAERSQPFLDVVKQAQTTTAGTVTAAALESKSEDTAHVLVAVRVKTSTIGAPEQDPRAWRMRISVQKVDDQMKISNVGFVP